jgi:sporulation protein YlmC with PRC-barrel domain
LIRLTDTDLELGDPAEDVRGRSVVDRSGEKVGKVEGLVIDQEERQVRFLEVGSGGVLGLGKTMQLVPVEAISSITDDVVQLSPERAHLAGAPAYDPELVESTYYEDVYRYYDYPPYWGPFDR